MRSLTREGVCDDNIVICVFIVHDASSVDGIFPFARFQ